MDTSKIGHAAATMMERMEAAGYPAGSELTDVIVITCVHRPDAQGRLVDDDSGMQVGNELIDYFCTSPRLLVHIGLMEMAREQASFGVAPSAYDEEDDE